MTESGWVAVDLDGTLAEYHGWAGADSIGKPIPLMLQRVRNWLARGVTVKIFTARATIPEQIPLIKKWLVEACGLPELDVVCCKDFAMIFLYDDRCIQVEMNTGKLVCGGEEK
jgi:hydroxymethylpyrimidine pyrophosphatase-like HAD family hydrolase